jgi:oxygen-independent coproporphyrinogen-3 oxidase
MPNSYSDDLLLDTSATLKKIFFFSKNNEMSIEVDPGTVRIEQLVVWKQLGINRLSIRMQNLNNYMLHTSNHVQLAQDFTEKAAHYYDNISIDLILGLPEVSEEEWKALINKVVTWPVKHISIDFLTIDEDVSHSLKKMSDNGALLTDEVIIALYEWTVATLALHGFERYEFGNFAKPGYESRHNTVYRERKPYKGFGSGACSFDGKKRFQNEKHLFNYMEAIEQHADATVFCEHLTPHQAQLERLMLGLRRKGGMALTDFVVDMLDEKKELFKKTVEELKKRKLLEEADGQLMLTTAGMAVENEIIVRLLR